MLDLGNSWCDNGRVDEIAQRIDQLIRYLLRLKGFRGSIMFVLDIDADLGSVKLKMRVLPEID